MNKLKRNIICICLCLLMTYSYSLTIYAKNENQIAMNEVNTECTSDLVIDMTTGEILFDKNIHDKLYPASVTKLLTGLLAIEYGDLNDTITFNADSVNLESGSSNLGFVEGEKIKLKDLLYGLMLKSANETANQLAYYIEEKSGLSFKDACSKKLQELGAFDTVFTTPSGLHKDSHYSTTYDISLVAKAAFKNDIFREVFTTQSYTIPKTNKAGEREVYNTHKMMFSSSPYCIESVLGGKTGYTGEAGHNLVTFSDDNGLKLLVVTFDGESYFTDTYRLIKYFNKNYETKTFYSKQDTFATIPVVDSSDVVIDKLDLKVSEDFKLTLPKNWSLDYVKDLIKAKRKENYEKEKLIKETNIDAENEEIDENDNGFNDDFDYDNLEITDELLSEYEIDPNDILMHIFDYKSDLFEVSLSIPEKISTTVLENDVVGNITIKFNDGSQKIIPIVSKEAYDLSNSIDFTILYIILFIGFAAILVIYTKKMIALTKEEKEIKNEK